MLRESNPAGALARMRDLFRSWRTSPRGYRVIRIKASSLGWLAAVLVVTCVPTWAAAPAPRVKVTTNMGEFVIEVFPDRAPLTVANFLRYARDGQYTNTIVHRVISNFVIQGGGHLAGDYTLKPTRDSIVNESGSGLQNKRGTVGLARGEGPHTGNSQFYINLADNPDLDPLPSRWGYSVFGRIIEGMSVIERIGVVPTGSVGPFKSDAPLQPIIIEKVEVLADGAASSAPQLSPSSGAEVRSPSN